MYGKDDEGLTTISGDHNIFVVVASSLLTKIEKASLSRTGTLFFNESGFPAGNVTAAALASDSDEFAYLATTSAAAALVRVRTATMTRDGTSILIPAESRVIFFDSAFLYVGSWTGVITQVRILGGAFARVSSLVLRNGDEKKIGCAVAGFPPAASSSTTTTPNSTTAAAVVQGDRAFLGISAPLLSVEVILDPAGRSTTTTTTTTAAPVTSTTTATTTTTTTVPATTTAATTTIVTTTTTASPPANKSFNKETLLARSEARSVISFTSIAVANPGAGSFLARTALAQRLGKCGSADASGVRRGSLPEDAPGTASGPLESFMRNWFQKSGAEAKYLALLIGNALIVIGFVAVHYTIAALWMCSMSVTMAEATQDCRFPSLIVLPLAILVPDTAAAAAVIAAGDSLEKVDMVAILFGVSMTLLAPLGLCLWVLYRVSSNSETIRLLTEDEVVAQQEADEAEHEHEEPPGFLKRAWIYCKSNHPADWRESEDGFSRRYGFFYDSYHSSVKWFFCVELLLSAVLGFCDGAVMRAVPKSRCIAAAGVSFVALLAYTLFICYRRFSAQSDNIHHVHLCRFDTAFAIVCGIVSAIVALSSLAQLASEREFPAAAQTALSIVALFVGAIGCIALIDVVFVFIDLKRKRERRQQEEKQAAVLHDAHGGGGSGGGGGGGGAGAGVLSVPMLQMDASADEQQQQQQQQQQQWYSAADFEAEAAAAAYQRQQRRDRREEKRRRKEREAAARRRATDPVLRRQLTLVRDRLAHRLPELAHDVEAQQRVLDELMRRGDTGASLEVRIADFETEMRREEQRRRAAALAADPARARLELEQQQRRVIRDVQADYGASAMLPDAAVKYQLLTPVASPRAERAMLAQQAIRAQQQQRRDRYAVLFGDDDHAAAAADDDDDDDDAADEGEPLSPEELKRLLG